MTEAEQIAALQFHLRELAKFADRAALVLAELEAESDAEEELLQEIIDGISAWAPSALMGETKTQESGNG